MLYPSIDAGLTLVKKESKEMAEVKEKKGKRNIKEELAAKYYINPQSGTYLNKTESLVKAGYSRGYALSYPKKIGDICNFAEILPEGVKTPEEDIRNWQNLAEKARKELHDEPKLLDKGSKFLAEINRMIELKLKHYGYNAPQVTESVQTVRVTVPLSKCPKCGTIMDIMKQDYEKASPVIDAESSDPEL